MNKLPVPVRLHFCTTPDGFTPPSVSGVLFRETPNALFLMNVVETAIPDSVEEMIIAESKEDGSDTLLVARKNVRAYERHSVIYVEFLEEEVQPDYHES